VQSTCNNFLSTYFRCMFLLLIDVFLLFVSVLNQLHPISIYIVYISVLLMNSSRSELLWLVWDQSRSKYCLRTKFQNGIDKPQKCQNVCYHPTDQQQSDFLILVLYDFNWCFPFVCFSIEPTASHFNIYCLHFCLISSVSYDEWRIKTVFITVPRG
jgi:hypothetical protein